MASNRLPDPLEELQTLGEDAADGARQLAAALGLKQNTEPEIRADFADLVAKKTAYDVVVAARPAHAAALAVARSNTRAFLTATRDVFKTFLGSQPSAAWAEAGWSSQSLAVPATSDLLLPLLNAVRLFLEAHPDRANAPLNLTAARATDLHAALLAARTAENAHADQEAGAKAARDASKERFRKRLLGLIAELGQLLDPLSPHWLAFGLNRPGAPERPEAVAETRASALGGGRVRVQCAPAPRADYYQVWLQVAGVDADFRKADSPREPDKLLEALPAGATVQIKLRAVNETGPGAFGGAVEVVVS
jgi:hypothetical protein